MEQLFTEYGKHEAENARDTHYKTPLHVALQEKDDDITLFIIRNSRDVNQRDGLFFTRYTPLHYAVFGSKEIMQELLKHGADVNARGYKKETPLNLACRFNRTDAALFLIDAGADLHTGSIYKCIKNDNFTIVQSMIDHGFNVNHAESSGYSAAHHAAKYNRPNVIRLLMTNGVNLDAIYQKKNRRGRKCRTPYDIAIENGSLEAADLLKKLGARPYTKGMDADK
ncbi:MAG: ankyrin repeat domain-containing protein [Holosporaceae bacterium]|jgi:ankyrin repeat protein|nr:ankyrin repeat domain-containing protein [Holosporaceae bacterium]